MQNKVLRKFPCMSKFISYLHLDRPTSFMYPQQTIFSWPAFTPSFVLYPGNQSKVLSRIQSKLYTLRIFTTPVSSRPAATCNQPSWLVAKCYYSLAVRSRCFSWTDSVIASRFNLLAINNEFSQEEAVVVDSFRLQIETISLCMSLEWCVVEHNQLEMSS